MASTQQMQSLTCISRESQASFIRRKNTQVVHPTSVSSSHRVLRGSRLHNGEKKSEITEVSSVLVTHRAGNLTEKTLKYPRVTVYGLPSNIQTRDAKLDADKGKRQSCTFLNTQNREVSFSSFHSSSSTSLVPSKIATRNQTARKSFPFIRDGKKSVVTTPDILQKSIESNSSDDCDVRDFIAPSPKDAPKNIDVNGSLISYSGLSELKIKTLHCSLHNMPNNMADPKVPVVMIDDSIKKALRDGHSGGQPVVSQFEIDSSVIYKGCSNFEVVKHVENAKVESENGDQASVFNVGNVEMPPLLCPSRINQDYSDRESSKSPEMPILTPVGLDIVESEEYDAPSVAIKDSMVVNEHVVDNFKPVEVIFQTNEEIHDKEATVLSSSINSPKRTPRKESHFQGRYAYMVGKRIRDPSRFIDQGRDVVMRRGTRPRGRPPSVLSRLKLWYDKKSRMVGGSVQKAPGKSHCRSIVKVVPTPLGNSKEYGRDGLIEQLGRSRRGRPRLRREILNAIPMERNPHIDVIDGLEFLSFETESDLKGFLRRHPSYTLSMSRLNEADDNSLLLSSSCNTTVTDIDHVNSSKLRLPGEPIVLTKTNDIRRIKGWRNKIFVPEALSDWNMDPDKLRELSMEQRLLLLTNFSPKELKERGLWELVASKYGTVKRDEELIEHRVGRSVVNEFGQILFDNRDIKDTCIPEISKSLESEQVSEIKPAVKVPVVYQKEQDHLVDTTNVTVKDECSSQRSIDQEKSTKDLLTQVTSEAATQQNTDEVNTSQANKSAFVSDFLNEFLRSHSELKISTALSTEQEQKDNATIDTKVVWPAQDSYPVQVFSSKQVVPNLTPPIASAVKRPYHRKVRLDERPSTKKLTKDPKPLQPVIASSNNIPSGRVIIEPVQMSMTDALFATTALVSRSLWDKDLGLLPSPNEIAKVFRTDVPESLECLQKRDIMCQKFSVVITPCHALRAATALPPEYCRQPSNKNIKDCKNISILKLRRESKEPSVENTIVSSPTVFAVPSNMEHSKEHLPPVTVKSCMEPFCKLGCVCSSLKGTKRRRIHCGKIQCMFKCVCEESENNGVQTDHNPTQPLKRRRQIRLPARLKDSLFLWTKGKSPLPNYVSNQVNVDQSLDKTVVEAAKARGSVLWKRSLPSPSITKSPLTTVIQKKTDSNTTGELPKYSNTSFDNSGSCTTPETVLSSRLPKQTSVTSSSNGIPSTSPVLLMVDQPLPSEQAKHTSGRSACHLLLNPDGTMVPCMIVPIDLNTSAESAADPLTPVTLTNMDPNPNSDTELLVHRPIIRQIASCALGNNKTFITYTRQTARKSLNTVMEQARIQKEMLYKWNDVKNQSVDNDNSIVKDVVDWMVRKVVMDEKLLGGGRDCGSGTRRSYRLSKARMALTRCLASQSNGRYVGSKVDGNKLRIAGLPHDWRSISKPLDEFPEFDNSLPKLQEVPDTVDKSDNRLTNSLEETAIVTPAELVNRADVHRQLEKKRRHEIRNSLHQLSSLITPYVFNSKEQKISQIPVQQCVLDMTTEVIVRLQEDESELLASKQNLIKHRMGLFKSYTELLQGLDMTKQKETIAELATKIQDCLKERSRRREKSQDLPSMIESLNVSSMSNYIFPNIDMDSSESNSIHTGCESDNEFSDMSLFESSDEEITNEDDGDTNCKKVGTLTNQNDTDSATSSLGSVVSAKNDCDHGTAVSIVPVITNGAVEQQENAVSDNKNHSGIELSVADGRKSASSNNGLVKNNTTNNDLATCAPKNVERKISLKEIHVSKPKSGGASWIPLHSFATGGEITLLTTKKFTSSNTIPSNEISLLAKRRVTAPTIAPGDEITVSPTLPVTITPGSEVTLVANEHILDEKSPNEVHKEGNGCKRLPLYQQLEKLMPGSNKRPADPLISKADSILNQISDCKTPLTIFGATTVTPITTAPKNSVASVPNSKTYGRDRVIKPVISGVQSRNGICNVPSTATPVSLVRNIFRSSPRKYNQPLTEITRYPKKGTKSINGNVIPQLLPTKSAGVNSNASPLVVTPVSSYLQKKRCPLRTSYYLEVMPANVKSPFPEEPSLITSTNSSKATGTPTSHSISDKLTSVATNSSGTVLNNNSTADTGNNSKTGERPCCMSDDSKSVQVQGDERVSKSIQERERNYQQGKEPSSKPDDESSDDWFKIVAFSSITEDEFWCKDSSAQDCAAT